MEFNEEVEDAIKEMLEDGSVRTIYDPFHRDLIFWMPEAGPGKNGLFVNERN